MKKTVLFVFNGDPTCFVHVLLNALDMHDKGYVTKIVIEGSAVKLLPELIKPENALNGLWKKNIAAGLIEGVCKACSQKMGTLETAEQQNLKLMDDMSGHPSMAKYQDNGYEIITF